jgi:N-acetylglucosaminyl-diphospho-decaprenol L-rhamnosyltransferase
VRVEVCVVAYESAATLPALVASLALFGDGVGLAVHDNGPGAATLDVAREAAAAAGIPLRAEACATGNCGFARGCNTLAGTSQADELLFLNPDALVLSWPAGLSAGGRLVGPRIVDTGGEETLTYGGTRTLGDEVALRWLRTRPTVPRGRGYVSGAAMLVDRERFLTLGGFDEGYFMYYEDIDLCHRAQDAGMPVVLEDGWRVEHVGGHSVGRSPAGVRRSLLRSYRSGRRYHERRGHSVRGYDVLCAVDALARAAFRAPLPRTRPRATADWAVFKVAARAALGRPVEGDQERVAAP